VTGVYLVSAVGDYYNPTSVMFERQSYEYPETEEPIEDGSFVTVGAGPFCLNVGDSFDIILAGPPAGSDDELGPNSVCKWTIPEGAGKQFVRRYKKIFGREWKRASFLWYDCAGGGGNGGNLGPFHTKKKKTTTTAAPFNYDPFAIMSPNFLSQKKTAVKSISQMQVRFSKFWNCLGIFSELKPFKRTLKVFSLPHKSFRLLFKKCSNFHNVLNLPLKLFELKLKVFELSLTFKF
jgi:hypothetical protein